MISYFGFQMRYFLNGVGTTFAAQIRRPQAVRMAASLLVCLSLCHLQASAEEASPGLPDAKTRQSLAKQDLSRLTEFKNDSPAFSIKYPQSWNTVDTKSATGEKLPPPFVFKAQTASGAVNFGITVEQTAAGTKLEDFVKDTLAAIEQVLRANGSSAKLESQKNVNVRGVPAYQVVLINQMPNFNAKQTMLMTLIQGQGVCITCSTAEEWYPQYEQLFQTMLQSVKLVKAK